MGKSFFHIGRINKSLDCFKKAISIKPSSYLSYFEIAKILRAQEKNEEALLYLKMSININPNFFEALNNIGNILTEDNKIDEAIEYYKKAIIVNPNYFTSYNNLGNTYNFMGDSDKAEKYYNLAIKIKPSYSEAYRNISLIKNYNADDEQIKLMEILLSDPKLNINDKINYNFALGNAYHNIENYKKAFSYYLNANKCKNNLSKYNINYHSNIFETVKSKFINFDINNNNVKAFKKIIPNSPIFIIGMPRTGTSLIEQILASHSKVFGAGELMTLEKSINSINNTSTNLNISYFSKLRSRYFSQIKKLDINEEFFTDKMPLNFIWVGYILNAFPDAKIIHTERDAHATCWSIFKRYFVFNGNEYSYCMSSLIKFYKLYQNMMEFWNTIFPDSIYNLNYEKFTQNNEREMQYLFDYLELNLEKSCKHFYLSKRMVGTASSLQIKKNIYQGSSKDWFKYKEFLFETFPQFKNFI